MLSYLASFLVPHIYLICLLPRSLSIPNGNFDSSEHLTCIGRPSQELPVLKNYNVFGDVNSRALTLQDLCVAPISGGSSLNIGGYCEQPPSLSEPDESGTIAFNIYPPPRRRPPPQGFFDWDVLQVPRFRAECLLRCFCSNLITKHENGSISLQLRDLTTQPKYAAHSAEMPGKYPPRLYKRSRWLPQITIDDRSNAFPDPRLYMYRNYQRLTQPPYGTYGDLRVAFESIEMAISAPQQYPMRPPRVFERLSIDQINYITCEGPMPTFTLPEPWSVAEFNSTIMHTRNNLTALCAVYQSGGYRSANAGGYCYNGTYGREVHFADEMTPRWDWTLDGRNTFAALSIRYHCWRHCRCKNPLNGTLTNSTVAVPYPSGSRILTSPSGVRVLPYPSGVRVLPYRLGLRVRPTSMQPVWDLLYDSVASFQVSELSDKSLQYQTRSVDGPSHKQQILPPQTGPGSPSGTCGADGRQFCPAQWPAEYVGPPPVAPPMIASQNAFGVSDLGVSKCGTSQTCHSPAGCGGDIDGPCRCVEPDARTARKYGLDPTFPPAICLMIMASSVGSSTVGGKRSLPQPPYLTLDGEGKPWRCLCNATYASAGCCTAPDDLL